jgi:arylsulfatase A-like enzyme
VRGNKNGNLFPDPNIDRLAARGTLFTRAYCAAPACNPSRVALMTGRRPSTTGVYHNPQPWRPVLPDVVTIPQHFMSHGYAAWGSGKIYHGAFPDPESWNEFFPAKTHLASDASLAEIKSQLATWLPAHDAPEAPSRRRR